MATPEVFKQKLLNSFKLYDPNWKSDNEQIGTKCLNVAVKANTVAEFVDEMLHGVFVILTQDFIHYWIAIANCNSYVKKMVNTAYLSKKFVPEVNYSSAKVTIDCLRYTDAVGEDNLLTTIEESECYICFDRCKTITICKHYLCRECYKKYNSDTCGYCRQFLTHFRFIEYGDDDEFWMLKLSQLKCIVEFLTMETTTVTIMEPNVGMETTTEMNVESWSHFLKIEL